MWRNISGCIEAVDGVKNIDDKVGDMWKRLDVRFGQPSMLVDVIMNEIKTIKIINDNDLSM